MNYEEFEELADCMADLLRGAPKTARAKLMYFDAISHLTPSRFEQVVEAAVKSLEWYPAAAWVLETAREIARQEVLRPIGELESAEARELQGMSEEECAANLLRIRKMLANAKL